MPTRTLLIEDETGFARYLSDELTEKGFDVDTAKTDADARAYLSAQAYQLVILDLGLDAARFDIQRESFCKSIRRLAPGVPVIGITNLKLTGERIFGLTQYLQAFFHKPEMTLAGFSDTVDRLLGVKPIADVPVGETPSRKSLFVSFCAENHTAVNQVVGLLRAEGVKVWWSGDGLSAGMSFQTIIKEQIEKSSVFLLFWSREASSSKWVEREQEIATNLEISRGHPLVICAQLDDTEPPTMLSNKQHVDLRNFESDPAGPVASICLAVRGENWLAPGV